MRCLSHWRGCEGGLTEIILTVPGILDSRWQAAAVQLPHRSGGEIVLVGISGGYGGQLRRGFMPWYLADAGVAAVSSMVSTLNQ